MHSPHLAVEADGWDPRLVSFGSGRRLPWRCTQGHSYTASVKNRVNGSGCPYCANKQMLPGFNDLATVRSDFADQANGWDPATTLAGGNERRQWRCRFGHTWEQSIRSRLDNNSGCPYCSNQRVWQGFNDLATVAPDLAQEADGWDPSVTLAGGKTPRRWKCSSGHRWEVSVGARVGHKSGCPACAGNRLEMGHNDVATLRPDLALEAVGWDPRQVSVSSKEKRRWRCEFGHEWDASPGGRRKSGCPVCAGNRVLVGFNDLSTVSPALAIEADGWDPKSVTRSSGRKLPWLGACGHRWEATVASRTLGTGCPYCPTAGSGRRTMGGYNDLATTHPHLAVQAVGWDPTTVSMGSVKRLRWRCPRGHEWVATPNNRTARGGRDCPVCSGRQLWTGFNDVATVNPTVAAEADGWDPSKMLAGSHRRVAWVCARGHGWVTGVRQRAVEGQGCPFCWGTRVWPGFNDLLTTHPLIAAQAVGWDPTTVSMGSGARREWRCTNTVEHVWAARVADRTMHESGCPYCTSKGFNAGLPAFMYLISRHGEQQFGITSQPENRLGAHAIVGWTTVLDVQGPRAGDTVREAERLVKKWLRVNVGVLPRNTEAWSTANLEVTNLRQLLSGADVLYPFD
jgi:hypothetical protein